MENEMNPQAIKYIMKVIYNVADSSPNKKFIYDFVMFDSLETFGVPNNSQVKLVFEWLRRKNVIDYKLDDSGIYDRNITGGRNEQTENQQIPYLVTILSRKEFRALYRKTLGDQVIAIKAAPSVLQYNKELGIGKIDGKEFSISRKNKKLFDKLVNRPGEWINKATILKIIDSRLLVKHSQSTIEINNAVTNLRKTTGMTTKQVELKSGNIRLNISLRIETDK